MQDSYYWVVFTGYEIPRCKIVEMDCICTPNYKKLVNLFFPLLYM